jgi:hypothetical protein
VSTKPTRSDERTEFLTDLLTTAIENGGHGWFTVDEYIWEDVAPGGAYALVTEDDGVHHEQHRIDLALITAGLTVIREAVPTQAAGGVVLLNANTHEKLYLSPAQRDKILLADRTNGEEGDFDSIDALAIVECGLFGKVVYA